MLMQRGSVTETTGWVLSSEGEYLKREVRPKDNFTCWKLTIMGDYCCCDGACGSDTVRGFYIALVHSCLSQGHPTGDVPSWPSRWRWSTAQWGSFASKDQDDCICRSDAAGQVSADSRNGMSPGRSVGSSSGDPATGSKSTWGCNADECNVWLLCRPHVAAGRERRGWCARRWWILWSS